MPMDPEMLLSEPPRAVTAEHAVGYFRPTTQRNSPQKPSHGVGEGSRRWPSYRQLGTALHALGDCLHSVMLATQLIRLLVRFSLLTPHLLLGGHQPSSKEA